MIIFRYRPPQEYLENEIVDGQIKFSPIITMNDFYDGYFQYSEKGDLEKHIKILKADTFNHAKAIIRRGQNKTQVQRNNEIHSQKNSLKWANDIVNTPGYFEKIIEQLRFDFKNHPEKLKETVKLQNKNAHVMRNNILICCLSKKKLCMSMYGYYAKDGTGVMLEYEDINRITKEVDYVAELPVITIDKTSTESIELQVFTKLHAWRHEEEMRAYIYNNNNTVNPILTTHGLKIKGVYLGPRIEKGYAQKVNEWSEKASVPVYSPSQNQYGFMEWA